MSKAVTDQVDRQPLVVARGLQRAFRSGDRLVQAVATIDLAIDRGSVVVVMGPSGSGKSTLLNLLGSLESPTAGEIYVDGTAVHNLSEGAATSYRRRKVGFIFQVYNLIPNLSALENVELPMEFLGVPAAERRERARACLAMAELPGVRYDHRPAQMSGGEQQRVAIARALVNDPVLILADEPTGSLDHQTGEQVLNLLCRLARENDRTVIIVTHDQSIAARADVVMRLRDGRVASIEGSTQAT